MEKQQEKVNKNIDTENEFYKQKNVQLEVKYDDEND